MALVTSTELLARARKEHYAVPAFNANCYEMINALIRAVEAEGAPPGGLRTNKNRALLWLWCSAWQFPKLFASRSLHPHMARREGANGGHCPLRFEACRGKHLFLAEVEAESETPDPQVVVWEKNTCQVLLLTVLAQDP